MKISSLTKCISTFAMMVIPTAAFAAPTMSGVNKIGNIVVYNTGYVVFGITLPPESAWSTCNLNHMFVVNLNTSGGRAIYETAVNAQLQNKNVVIAGSGTCSTMSQVEDVSYLQMYA